MAAVAAAAAAAALAGRAEVGVQDGAVRAASDHAVPGLDSESSASTAEAGVGAAELLRPDRGESFDIDMAAPAAAVAEAVAALLRDRGLLHRTGLAAQARALSWDEAANAKAITALVDGALR